MRRPPRAPRGPSPHARARKARVISPALVALCALGACSREDTAPSNPQAPPGDEKKGDTRVLEKGAEVLQNLSPVRSLNLYLNGFHVMKDDPSLHMEAHHYCRNMNEEFSQCVIFDGNTDTSNLIGLEYIISERLFESLADDEKALWHPHNYEILSGQLVLPGVPVMAEKATLEKKINSYGKTWHVWDTGHAGHPAAHTLPVGEPLLAWSYNRDGEIPAGLIEDRDRRMKIDTAQKRSERSELSSLAKPQRGTDLLKDKLPGSGAPPGVSGR